LILSLLGSASLKAQVFENGFDFNLPWDDTSTVDFLPFFDMDSIGEEDRVSTDGAGSFVVQGKPYRFFGGNLTAQAAFPSKEDAALVAGRMKKFGINLIRFHHIDNPWSDGSLFHEVNGTRELNAERLDRLDYLIYQLKQHGIYVNMNLNVSRTFENADGVVHADSLSDFGKGVTQFDPRMISLQKEYASKLLGHVNPYTGTRLADDPVLAMLEIINENTLFRMWYANALKPIAEGGKLPWRYAEQLDSLWIVFLEGKYKTTDSLEQAWNTSSRGGDTLFFDGFENGLGSAWELELHETAAGTLALTDQAASGSSAALVNVTAVSSETWHTQFKLTGESVKKDSTYEIIFKAKSDRDVTIGISFMRDNSPWTYYGGEDLNLTPEWKEFKFSFKAPEDNVGQLRISFGFNHKLGSFYFDDFLLRTQQKDGLLEGESLEAGRVDRLDRSGIFAVSEQRLMDQTEFYLEIQTGFLDKMSSFLRDSLGVQAPMTGTNWFTGPEDVYVERHMDFIDNHSYWDHPHFPNESWSPTDWTINNEAMISSQSGTIDYLFSGLAIKDKPLTVSEYNHAFPNSYQAELLPLITSYLSFNDADGFMIFTYSGDWYWERNFTGSFFDIHRNSSLMGSFPIYAYAFRNFLIDAGSEVLSLDYSKDDILRMPSHIEEWWRGHYPYDPQLAFSHRLEMSLDRSEDFDPGSLPGASPGPYSLSEDQVRWDKEGSLIINTERFASVSGFMDRLSPLNAGKLEVLSASDFGSVAWLSLVDSALDESSRSLLAIATKIQNTGMIWDGSTTVHDKWGWSPTQIYPLKLELKLKTKRSHLRMTPMNPVGRLRSEEADTVAADSSGYVWVYLDQEKDHTLWYAVEAMDMEEVRDTITGAYLREARSLLRCYPNPARQEVFFELNEPAQTSAELVIRDLKGRAVYEGILRNRLRMDSSAFPPGIYVYQVKGQDFYAGRFAVIR
jgi:hypothetical protein